jgi:hypothetical protein
MKAITNLNLLDVDKLLIDDEDRLFIVLSAEYNRDQTCTLHLLELNKEFTKHSATFPIACNKELNFVSINDKDFVYQFTEINVTKEQISKLLNKEVRAMIDTELKKEK